MPDKSSAEWGTTLIESLGKVLVERALLTAFPGETAVITLAVGKSECAFEICDGQITELALEAAESAPKAVRIPLSKTQLAGLCDGTAELSSCYMRGDIKPVGSIRALLLVIEVFDDRVVQEKLASLTN